MSLNKARHDILIIDFWVFGLVRYYLKGIKRNWYNFVYLKL